MQLPSDIAIGGPLQVQVTNGGVTSAPVNVTVNATEPGPLTPTTFQVGGNQYVAALLPDGTYAMPTGAVAGVNSRPAAPGETITVYGIGFGSVTPAFLAGQIVTQPNQLMLPLQVMFGQTAAQVSYSGLAPNLVGLYQFNVVVPDPCRIAIWCRSASIWANRPERSSCISRFNSKWDEGRRGFYSGNESPPKSFVRFSNLVNSLRNTRFTRPVGPLRCLASSSSAMPFKSSRSGL